MCVCGNRIDFKGQEELGTCRACQQTYWKTDQRVSLK
jgi:hypothetical protein